jgi:eukaryotic-like serine/threonine-protein kinase
MTRPASAPVREGDMLAGKYRVERVLGAGGMGIVVAARHEQLDQLVAIKFVREEALENEEAVQRFLREARAAVKLKSEHVARVLDVGKLDSGAPYMVMEYLEGDDVANVLSAEGPRSVETAAEWVLQACEAVAEAHAAGIVHRDLKPENLFLTRTVGGVPKIKVLDFGVSKSIGASSSGEVLGLTQTRTMLGSPLYMAPEQMRSSRDVDARADVWALGVVLFHVLTVRYPFEAETMPELCLKVVTEPPLSLAELHPDVPTELVAIVTRCLDKDPTKRYANAAELASALEPFVHPASRLIAERARLAMRGSTSQPGTASLAGSPARPSALRVTPASAIDAMTPGARGAVTLTADASGNLPTSTPSPSGPTPGTAVGWDSGSGPLRESTHGRSRVPIAIGVALAGLAAWGTIALTARHPSSAATPGVATEVVATATPPSMAAGAAKGPGVMAAPEVQLAEPPAVVAPAASIAPEAQSAAPKGASSSGAPVPAPSAPVAANPMSHKVSISAPPAPVHPSARPAADDDIPTIR